MKKKYHQELLAGLQIYMRQMHDITKHVLQVLFHHEICQLLSNLHQSSRNLIQLAWHSVALLVYYSQIQVNLGIL